MTTTSKTIKQADISLSGVSKVILGVWYVIAFIVYVMGADYHESYYFGEKAVYYDRWFIYDVAFRESDGSLRILENFFIALPIYFIVFVLPILLYLLKIYRANRCSLVLTDKGLSGQCKKIFSTAQLQLPMDKIDNIMVTENLINKIDGGKTVAIRSASGLIKFPWVQNADEFVNATLAEIEKYNQSLKNVDQNLVSAISGNSVQKAQPEKSAAQKIKDLKELLDSGLITQDEFDAKKKDLLDKM